MFFETPLIKGTILKRYKRFLADIKLEDGKETIAHVANTGAMTSCWQAGWPVLLSKNDNPKRKLKYSLEMLNNGKSWIGVNTYKTNKLGIEAIRHGIIKGVPKDCLIKPEFNIGKSRLDLYLEYNDLKHFIEIKNVTLKSKIKNVNYALFPDAVTKRGQKHIEELISLRKQGYLTSMLFIIQREDIEIFKIADEVDPKYGQLLQQAQKEGVQILVYGCKLTTKEISVIHSVPFK